MKKRASGWQADHRALCWHGRHKLREYQKDWVLEKEVPPFTIRTASNAPEAIVWVQAVPVRGGVFDRRCYCHVLSGFYARKISVTFCVFVSAVDLLFCTESQSEHLDYAGSRGRSWGTTFDISWSVRALCNRLGAAKRRF